MSASVRSETNYYVCLFCLFVFPCLTDNQIPLNEIKGIEAFGKAGVCKAICSWKGIDVAVWKNNCKSQALVHNSKIQVKVLEEALLMGYATLLENQYMFLTIPAIPQVFPGMILNF